MKKFSDMCTKILSLLLVISMLCSTAFAIQPMEQNKGGDGISTVYLSDNVKIDAYESQDGNTILCEYTDGILTQRNTIFKGNNSYYQREIFGENPICEFVYVDEYISADPCLTSYDEAKSITMHGNIQFRNMTTYGYVYNKLNCTCVETKVGQTTHTIHEFTGNIIDLVSLVVSLFACPPIVGLGSFLKALAAAMGVEVAGEIIKGRLTCTLACIKTDYDWQIANSNIPDETKYFSGHSYFINDVNAPSNLKGVTDYEPYTPNDWRTSGLATTFHNAVFGYAPDEIIGWSRLG